ncbi:MoeA N-terminal region-like protein [Parathielavia hyrcaniae]|uniref:molybdopterin adenylyltransferase n=1 Tax=Parathielavia hyrcaniae TaxID=113614 RepID=A0AAN6SZX0_9PEZI|nr:MoeA N-terminal region-like protein [Parathielavia hyrcaniae]
MAISYSAGLAKVLDAAQQQRSSRQDWKSRVRLQDAIGGTAAQDVLSPKSLPEHDTSAMDGYAVRSQATATASPNTPVMFMVTGTIAAGDDPGETRSAGAVTEQDSTSGLHTCVEIMTGARFPNGYDACVKVEDTMPVDGQTGILITKPVPPNANRRVAGSDILRGNVVMRQGDTIQPSHLLPLASLGMDAIPLRQRPCVGIWSTGKEIVKGNGSTRDANGPYLTAAVRDMGLQADFLGVLDDEPASLHAHVEAAAASGQFDVLLTTGGVSRGRFDHVLAVVDEMGAETIFHGLSIRPGHPVLFAMLPGEGAKTALFGLPGNPGAAAACFRFLTVPYLKELQGQARELPVAAKLRRQPGTPGEKRTCSVKPDRDCFQHGILSVSAAGQLMVEASAEQSPFKLSPFKTANCWIHFQPESPESGPGPGLVECYPISPTGAVLLSPRLQN